MNRWARNVNGVEGATGEPPNSEPKCQTAPVDSVNPPLMAAGSGISSGNISELVGEIYEVAPVTWRCRMIEHLVSPLGALALVGVCNGIFAKIWFRSGLQQLQIRPEDAQAVQAVDVASLADYVQQASTETINGLASLLATSPMVMYSAAAATLIAILLRRSTRDTGHGNTP